MTIEEQIKRMNEKFSKRAAEVRAGQQVKHEDYAKENEKARRAWQAKLAADRQRIEEMNEASERARQQREEVNLRSHLHAAFMSSNPAASESDFERLYPMMRDEHFKQQTSVNAGQAAEFRTGIYSDLL